MFCSLCDPRDKAYPDDRSIQRVSKSASQGPIRTLAPMLHYKGTECITIPARLDSRKPAINRKPRIYPSSFSNGTYAVSKLTYQIGLMVIGKFERTKYEMDGRVGRITHGTRSPFPRAAGSFQPMWNSAIRASILQCYEEVQ